MIQFQRAQIKEKEMYERYLWENETHGCEYSFANLFMWGEQSIAELNSQVTTFAEFYQEKAYHYPLGKGQRTEMIDAIIADAKEHGHECILYGLLESDKQELEELYPNRFSFEANRDMFDYVYNIDDLAELKGRSYQSKRNHIHRFQKEFPNYRVQEIDASKLETRRLLPQRYC